MFIDPHVHFRDFNQWKKETVRHGLEVARDSGVDAVIDMPNTDPPILTEELVARRLELARLANVREVFYGLHMGLSNDMEQVKRAVGIYNKFPQVVGMKLYAGHSVGNMGVVSVEDQEMVYETLAREGFGGVLVVHAEKESGIKGKLWTPEIPVSHCLARPESAEVESVADQLRLLYITNFRGTLHFTHMTSPVAIGMINDKRMHGRSVSVGVCPHHLVYDWSQMNNEDGLIWKMNPPLRSPKTRNGLVTMLETGEIDSIETDHAPHLLEEKTKHPFMSGIPGLPWWPVFEEYLRSQSLSDSQIEKLTFSSARDRYGLDVERTRREIFDRRKDYEFNPYSRVENDLGWAK